MKRAYMALFLLVLMSCCLQGPGDDVSTTKSDPTTTSTVSSSSSTTYSSTTTLLPKPTVTLPVITEPAIAASLRTDRESYGPLDRVNMSVVVNSSHDLENVSLHLYGIPGFYYPYHIERIKEIDLDSGENVFLYQYKVPDCYGCTALEPGRYNLTLEIEYQGKTYVNTSREIELT